MCCFVRWFVRYLSSGMHGFVHSSAIYFVQCIFRYGVFDSLCMSFGRSLLMYFVRYLFRLLFLYVFISLFQYFGISLVLYIFMYVFSPFVISGVLSLFMCFHQLFLNLGRYLFCYIVLFFSVFSGFPLVPSLCLLSCIVYLWTVLCFL